MIIASPCSLLLLFPSLPPCSSLLSRGEIQPGNETFLKKHYKANENEWTLCNTRCPNFYRVRNMGPPVTFKSSNTQN